MYVNIKYTKSSRYKNKNYIDIIGTKNLRYKLMTPHYRFNIK